MRSSPRPQGKRRRRSSARRTPTRGRGCARRSTRSVCGGTRASPRRGRTCRRAGGSPTSSGPPRCSPPAGSVLPERDCCAAGGRPTCGACGSRPSSRARRRRCRKRMAHRACAGLARRGARRDPGRARRGARKRVHLRRRRRHQRRAADLGRRQCRRRHAGRRARGSSRDRVAAAASARVAGSGMRHRASTMDDRPMRCASIVGPASTGRGGVPPRKPPERGPAHPWAAGAGVAR